MTDGEPEPAPSCGRALGLLEQPLSPMAAYSLMSGPISSRVLKWRVSEASPPVRSKAMMSPVAVREVAAGQETQINLRSKPTGNSRPTTLP